MKTSKRIISVCMLVASIIFICNIVALEYGIACMTKNNNINDDQQQLPSSRLRKYPSTKQILKPIVKLASDTNSWTEDQWTLYANTYQSFKVASRAIHQTFEALDSVDAKYTEHIVSDFDNIWEKATFPSSRLSGKELYNLWNSGIQLYNDFKSQKNSAKVALYASSDD